MRLTLVLLEGIVAGQPSYADVIRVPLLTDGTVNTEEVLSAFKLTFPIFENGVQSTDFTGELLGEPFTSEVTGVNAILEFTLSIEAPKLSEHGNFLITTLVTDVFCLEMGSAQDWCFGGVRATTIAPIGKF